MGYKRVKPPIRDDPFTFINRSKLARQILLYLFKHGPSYPSAIARAGVGSVDRVWRLMPRMERHGLVKGQRELTTIARGKTGWATVYYLTDFGRALAELVTYFEERAKKMREEMMGEG